MNIGDISSTKNTVGTSVVNYPAPVIGSEREVEENARRMASMVEGIKRGIPGVDLNIFPEYSLQDFNPKKWKELSTTVDSETVEILKEAATKYHSWIVTTLTGEVNEDPKRNPYDTAIMISDDGKVVLKYRKIMPWAPIEPWYPGRKVEVVEGLKGLKTAVIICDDGNYPEIWREAAMKGAELIVRVQGYMYPPRDQVSTMSKAMAWANNSYVAVSNLAGYDGTYYYFGHSQIIGYDGTTLGEAGESPYETIYAQLSIPSIREARSNWTSENHLYKLLHRGYTATYMAGEGEYGISECPFDFYKTWVNDPEDAKEAVESLTYKLSPGLIRRLEREQ